jgi:hypothetical protein
MATMTQQDRAVQEPFELVLRLQQSRSSQLADSAAGLRSRAQAVVKDLLMSRLEVDVDVTAQEYVHVHGFCDLGRALGASRALQLAFEGLCSAVPNGANVSIILDSSAPEDAFSVDPGPTVEHKDLLASAKPFQVLVTQAFYNKLQYPQPVALRSFPASSGVYEFLWTGEERLAELQNQDEFMPTLVIPARSSTATGNSINDKTFFMDLDDRPAQETPAPVLQDRPGIVDRKSGQRPHRQIVIAIACAAVILLVLGYLGFANTPLISRLKESVLPHTAGGGPPARPSSSALPPLPTPVPAPAPSPPPPTPVPAPAPAPFLPNPPPAPRHACSTDTNLIPGYLDLAETNLKNGKYDAAIRQFQKLLGCESVSREAREGLQRAKKAQQANGTGQQSQ